MPDYVRSTRPGQQSNSRFLHCWVNYDAAMTEAVIYDHEPPARFGLGGYDIGPIQLDEELVKEYAAAKEAWRAAHLHFVAAVRDAANNQDAIEWG